MRPTSVVDENRPASESRLGAIQGLTAYIMWGSFPAFFKTVASAPTPEVLAHRITWSAVFLLLFIFFTGNVGRLRSIITDRRAVPVLVLTTLLVATNWFFFLTAVSTGRVLESSLGYYINPLVSVFLGFVFLGERLSARQWLSIALAAAGVAIQTVMVGRLPIISLVLAFTFGTYGLVRKVARVPAVTGLAVEMILISPLALAYLGLLLAKGEAAFLDGRWGLDIMLVLAGVVTATPLILYGGALNRLRLSTMGIMQYIVPTGHFLWAVLAFGERFTTAHMVSFALIWAALVLYTSGTIASLRPATQAAGQSGESMNGGGESG